MKRRHFDPRTAKFTLEVEGQVGSDQSTLTSWPAPIPASPRRTHTHRSLASRARPTCDDTGPPLPRVDRDQTRRLNPHSGEEPRLRLTSLYPQCGQTSTRSHDGANRSTSSVGCDEALRIQPLGNATSRPFLRAMPPSLQQGPERVRVRNYTAASSPTQTVVLPPLSRRISRSRVVIHELPWACTESPQLGCSSPCSFPLPGSRNLNGAFQDDRDKRMKPILLVLLT